MMSRRSYLYPRSIDPSLIEEGDTILVTHHTQYGLEHSIKGTVAYIETNGQLRTFNTAEHGVIFLYEVGKPKHILILLLRRKAYEQQPLPYFSNVDEELRNRISA